MLPGIGPTHRPVSCFPARAGPIPCADRLFRVHALEITIIQVGYFAMILPGLKLLLGSIALNSPSIMCTPGAEMSCSNHAACSVPTAW